ncbi:MAG: glycosyltransferase [Cellulomonas sp.]
MGSSRPIRVLQPFRELQPTTNPYIVMLHRALENTPGVEPLMFSYRRALCGGYDVVHLHWPETRLEGRTPLRRAVRRALAFAYLLRLRILRIPVVRTVHNLEHPAGLNGLDHLYLRLVDRWTTLRIVINEATPIPAGQPTSVILHGHYREWFAPYPSKPAVPGRLGYAGLVRRYKNVDGLVGAFREAHSQEADLSLLVAGKPSTAELEEEVRAAAGNDDAVTFELRFLDDADLVRVVTSSELVTLPYRHMHNSGAALLALSLNRPVLLPANPATRSLQREVGPGWVHLFNGELDGSDLVAALAAAREPRAAQPDLSRREWSQVGRAHRDAYARALLLRRGLPA